MLNSLQMERLSEMCTLEFIYYDLRMVVFVNEHCCSCTWMIFEVMLNAFLWRQTTTEGNLLGGIMLEENDFAIISMEKMSMYNT